MTNTVLKTVTDEDLKEKQRHGSRAFPFGFYTEDVYAFHLHGIDWHWHNEIEIVYAERGDIICYVGADKLVLEQGSALFVNSGVLHSYEAVESVCMPNIVFLPELLGDPLGEVFVKFVKPIIESGMEYSVFLPTVEWQNDFLKILREIFALQDRSKFSELQTVARLLDLWSILYDNLRLTDGVDAQSKEMRHKALLQVMMQYIHAHYNERIALSDISASVYISKNSALQIFKTCIRLSPIAYLIRYRLSRAAELLASTDKTVERISDEAGFENPSYFCRRFKALYKLSPAQYRKIVRQEADRQTAP